MRQKVGLALGGGAMRGMAHIGVLSVLHSAEIPIDYVAGASAGAIVGALFCARLDPAEMAYIASKLKWWDLARPEPTQYGLLTFDKLEQLLIDLLGDLTFADLDIPLALATADMQTGEQIILQEGRLAPAVCASCAIPGIFNPVTINGRRLNDGGVLNNLPVSVARKMGAEFVIASDVFEPAYGRNGNPLMFGLTAIEILIDRAGGGYDTADCLIQPELGGATFISPSKLNDFIAAGKKAATAQLPILNHHIDGQRMMDDGQRD